MQVSAFPRRTWQDSPPLPQAARCELLVMNSEYFVLTERFRQVTKADFVQHLKSCNTNLLKQFTNVAPESDEKWNNLANTAFKIFDMNGDGFVDKKEFKRMTNSKKINQRVIDILFEVLRRLVISAANRLIGEVVQSRRRR